MGGVGPAARDEFAPDSPLQGRDGMGQAARRWHHRRCNQLMACPDAPAERLLSTGVACCRPGRPHSGHPHFALAGAAPAVRFATDSALEGADLPPMIKRKKGAI